MKPRIKAYSNDYYKWLACAELFDKTESVSMFDMKLVNKTS